MWWRLSLIYELSQSNGLVSIFILLQEKMVTLMGKDLPIAGPSLSGLSLSLFICVCSLVVYMLYVVYMFAWMFLVFKVLGDL